MSVVCVKNTEGTKQTACCYKTEPSDFRVTELNSIDETLPSTQPQVHNFRYIDLTLTKTRESNAAFIDIARALTDAARRLNVLSSRGRKRTLEGNLAPLPSILVLLPVEIGRIQKSGIKDGRAVTIQRVRLDMWGKQGSKSIASIMCSRKSSAIPNIKDICPNEPREKTLQDDPVAGSAVVKGIIDICTKASVASKKGGSKAPWAGITDFAAFIALASQLLKERDGDKIAAVVHTGMEEGTPRVVLSNPRLPDAQGPLQIGIGHRGNAFDLILRDFPSTLERNTFVDAYAGVREIAFLNFYGEQRFGGRFGGLQAAKESAKAHCAGEKNAFGSDHVTSAFQASIFQAMLFNVALAAAQEDAESEHELPEELPLLAPNHRSNSGSISSSSFSSLLSVSSPRWIQEVCIAATACGAKAWADGTAPMMRACPGSTRACIARATHMQVTSCHASDKTSISGDASLCWESRAARVQFRLPPGAYATVLLAHLTGNGATEAAPASSL